MAWTESHLGSGGGNYSETSLLSSPIVGNTSYIDLTDDISNYDFLIFIFGVSTAALGQESLIDYVPVNAFKNLSSGCFYISKLLPGNFGMYYSIKYNTERRITVINNTQSGWGESRTIFDVIGVKF